MAKKYVVYGELLGEEFKVDEDTANDIMFDIETSKLCDTLTGAQIAIEMGEQLALAVEFFNDFKLDLKRGVLMEWFEKASVDNICKVADTLILKAQAQMN
jgi:hypothetical protein